VGAESTGHRGEDIGIEIETTEQQRAVCFVELPDIFVIQIAQRLALPIG
jgi:hypothetical protein